MSTRKSKIMVISSKGGVGKSTLNMQLITPFLYEKNGYNNIAYYEFDNENHDSLSFANSALSERNSIDVTSPILREELVNIFSRDEYACFDIGGNRSTSLVLDALHESAMVHFIDLVVIPLLDGEQDGINASITYTLLKEMNPDIKVLFVLNRARNMKYLKYQFENFFGDIRGIFQDKYAVKHYLFEDDIENFAALLDDDIIKYSRRFGLTVYEIAKQQRDFIDQLKVQMDELSSEQEVRMLSFKNYMDRSSKKYYDDIIKPAFEKIETLLEDRK